MAQQTGEPENPPLISGSDLTPSPKQVKKASPVWIGVAITAIMLVVIVVMLLITSADVKETPAPVSLEGVAQNGKELFQVQACYTCHPSEGRAGGIGPRLSTTNISDNSIRNTIKNGRGAMPSYRTLSDEQLNQLISYIRAIHPA